MKAAAIVAGRFVVAVVAMTLIHGCGSDPLVNCYESLGQLPSKKIVILDHCRGDVFTVQIPGSGDPVLYQQPSTTTSTTLLVQPV